MNVAIQNIFGLMADVFGIIIANPLLALLIGIIVVSLVVGIVTSVFSPRRRSRSRR